MGATHNAEWCLRGDPQRFQLTVMCTKAGRRVSETVDAGYDEERTKSEAIASLCD